MSRTSESLNNILSDVPLGRMLRLTITNPFSRYSHKSSRLRITSKAFKKNSPISHSSHKLATTSLTITSNMALESYFATLKLNTGASHFIVAEDRAVRTIRDERKMEQPQHFIGVSRQASFKFSTNKSDQPLACPMRQRCPSIDESDLKSIGFSDKASRSRWSPPPSRWSHPSTSTSLRKHILEHSSVSPPQSRRNTFSSASRSTWKTRDEPTKQSLLTLHQYWNIASLSFHPRQSWVVCKLTMISRGDRSDSRENRCSFELLSQSLHRSLGDLLTAALKPRHYLNARTNFLLLNMISNPFLHRTTKQVPVLLFAFISSIPLRLLELGMTHTRQRTAFRAIYGWQTRFATWEGQRWEEPPPW